MTQKEINNKCQTQDVKSRVVVFEAIRKHYAKTNTPYKIEANSDEFGAYDFTLEVNDTLYYCELKERNYKSTSFDGDFFEDCKLHKLNRISPNILFFASFKLDETILIYNVNSCIKRGRFSKRTFETDHYTVAKGEKSVKTFYNLFKTEAKSIKW